MWIYLWAFCFVPLIYISVFVPEATNSRIMEAEDRISEIEVRMVEINESEWYKRHCISLTKEARTYNGEKTISLTSGAGKTGQPLVKE